MDKTYRPKERSQQLRWKHNPCYTSLSLGSPDRSNDYANKVSTLNSLSFVTDKTYSKYHHTFPFVVAGYEGIFSPISFILDKKSLDVEVKLQNLHSRWDSNLESKPLQITKVYFIKIGSPYILDNCSWR